MLYEVAIGYLLLALRMAPPEIIAFLGVRAQGPLERAFVGGD